MLLAAGPRERDFLREETWSNQPLKNPLAAGQRLALGVRELRWRQRCSSEDRRQKRERGAGGKMGEVWRWIGCEGKEEEMASKWCFTAEEVGRD